MKLLPRTLFGQVALALVVGLVVAHVLGAWLMLADRERLGERLRGEYAAQRIAGIISLLDGTAPDDRRRIVKALSIPPLRLDLDEPWAERGDDSPEASAFLRRVARELDSPLPLQVLSIRAILPPRMVMRHRDDTPLPPPPGAMPPRFLQLVLAQAKLSDGAVLTFRFALPEPPHDWPLRALGLLLVVVLTVAILAGWTVRRLTRPLASLADAASGLARNLDQPPLPETGPLEVARAAQAFNRMQQDLRNFLNTRAQALAAVSHDLRLPLTRLRFRLEQMGDDALRRKIESDIAEMEGMIGATLDFLRAGGDTEAAVRLDLNALIDGVAEDLRELGAEIAIHGQAAAPILAPAAALRRCLVNLLDNARRHGGGSIDLSIEDRGSALDVVIEDRGPGIPPEQRERVFEPYVRLEASRARHTGGTGLGLAIARAIARAQGGDIRIDAREGGGARVVLTLPRRENAT
jgi:signal transduction histidine kinase